MCKNNGFSVLTGLGLELAAEPLRAPVWEPKMGPSLAPNAAYFRPEGGKGGEKKGVQKWTPKKIDEKSVGSRKRARRRS